MKIFIESNHPQTILKYNPCTQYSKEAFIEHYLFASHPFHLNDLMDGKSYSIDMRNVSDELYYEIKRQTIEQAPLIDNDHFHLDICKELILLHHKVDKHHSRFFQNLYCKNIMNHEI